MKQPGINSLKLTAKCSISIDNELDKLWQIISTPGILEVTHPFCEKNEVIQWNGSENKDVIIYFNGRTMYRNFIDWNIGQGYKLLIGHNELADAMVTWSIEEIQNESVLSIDIELYLDHSLRHLPKVLRKIIGRIYLVPTMKSYLDSVLSGFKYFAETGDKVVKNQFGYNHLFSTHSNL